MAIIYLSSIHIHASRYDFLRAACSLVMNTPRYTPSPPTYGFSWFIMIHQPISSHAQLHIAGSIGFLIDPHGRSCAAAPVWIERRCRGEFGGVGLTRPHPSRFPCARDGARRVVWAGGASKVSESQICGRVYKLAGRHGSGHPQAALPAPLLVCPRPGFRFRRFQVPNASQVSYCIIPEVQSIMSAKVYVGSVSLHLTGRSPIGKGPSVRLIPDLRSPM